MSATNQPFIDNRLLVPDGIYLAHVHAVRQGHSRGSQWTTVALEIAEGFFQKRVVNDFIVRKSATEPIAVAMDRQRELRLVQACQGDGVFSRACREMIGILVKMELVTGWRRDKRVKASRPSDYWETEQF